MQKKFKSISFPGGYDVSSYSQISEFIDSLEKSTENMTRKTRRLKRAEKLALPDKVYFNKRKLMQFSLLINSIELFL